MALWLNDGTITHAVQAVQRGETLHMRIGATEQTVELLRWAPPHFTVRTDDGRIVTGCVSARAKEITVTHGEGAYRLTRRNSPMNDSTARASNGEIHAPLPGRLVALLVEVGTTVRRGQPLCVIEAMKMQNEILAPSDGTVASIVVTTGLTVEGGTLLMNIA